MSAYPYCADCTYPVWPSETVPQNESDVRWMLFHELKHLKLTRWAPVDAWLAGNNVRDLYDEVEVDLDDIEDWALEQVMGGAAHWEQERDARLTHRMEDR